jgi:hypothetical protein
MLLLLLLEPALLEENGVWAGVRFVCEGTSALCCELTNISKDYSYLTTLGYVYEISGYSVFVFFCWIFYDSWKHFQHSQNGNSSPLSS